MPGPRAKQAGATKNKHKAPATPRTVASTSSSTTIPTDVLDTLSELSDWDRVAKVPCDHFQLPDLATRSGLKKVYHNFADVYKQTNDAYVAYEANELVRGGIVALYVKMCSDSILRNMLFHQEGLLAKIIALIDKPNSRHLALRALTTITQHVPAMIKLMQDYPDDLFAAELAITTIAHAATCSLDEPQKPAAKHIISLQLSKLIPLVLSFLGKPGVGLPLLHHALELFGNLTQHRPKDCLRFPDLIDFLVACIRSADMHSRFFALASVIRLHTPEPERIFGDPYTLISAMRRGLSEHLSELLVDYGLMRCESTLTLQSFKDYQKAMMQCVKDRDLYELGLALAELVPRNEYAISEGAFQAINERTGKPEVMDVGLPFKMWVDALPMCAKAIRERGKVGEEDLADMLDMKYFVIRSRAPEAIAVAKKGIERNPKFAYPYYIMTIGDDAEAGLRYAKKGLKCKKMSPFVNHALRARATELASNLAVCRMQESTVGDDKWEQALAFMSSALDDAQIFLAQAPPDMRHRRTILYWFIALTLAEKGPELSIDLRELKKYTDMVRIADEFFKEFGAVAPKTQLLYAHEHIFSRYAAAADKWGAVVARLDSQSMEKHILSRDKVEDRLAAWLNEVQDESGEDGGDKQAEGPPHVKRSKEELHRCSWCGNPSAVLRKCGGCEKARYCDASCQKMAWSEHKGECKSRKTASSSV